MDRKFVGRLMFSVFALVLVVVILYSGLQILESALFLAPQEMEVTVRKTITKDGVKYYPRQDITTVLVMGIDQNGPAVLSEDPYGGRPVDMVSVVIIDEKEQNCKVLNINRDTMLEMPMLNEAGREAGTFYGQLAYSHTYGRGGEDSCENTRKAVSNFLYGITMDYYIAMNTDAVTVLNDAVGGVTVDVRDDFSQIDPEIAKGVYLLKGDKALHFVQSRKGVGDELNLSRIERQKEYVNGFVEAFRGKLQGNETFLLKTYEKVAPYIVSDLPISTLSSLVERCKGFSVADSISLAGENRLGELYYEFYPDEEKLESLILELFYAPK